MQVISLLAQKGGVGKTTLSIHFAVQASLEGSKAALIDIDPQGSLSAWALRREQQRDSEHPTVLQAKPDQLEEVIDLCRDHTFDYVFIDTLPRVEDSAAKATDLSDIVIIPTGPSARDIEAIGPTVSLAESLTTEAFILVNRGRPGSSINDQAIEILSDYGVAVCQYPIMNRAIFQDSDIDGGTAMEHEPKGKASMEVKIVWNWIESKLSKLQGRHGSNG